MHPMHDQRWIAAAIPDARMTIVRLLAQEDTLMARLARRETGSGRDEQVQRTLRQARRMAGERLDALRIASDGATPQALAATILRAVGWLPEHPQQA